MKNRRHKKRIWLAVILGMLVLIQSGFPQPAWAGEMGSETGSNSSEDNSTEPTTELPPSTELPDAAPSAGGTEAPSDTQASVVIPEVPEEEAPVHTPKVVVSGCSTDVEQIEPGMEVTFTVTLKNTSTDVPVYNMKVTYESASGELIPLEATNSRYIGSLGAGSVTSLSFSMRVPKDLNSFSQKLTITMEYEDEKAMSYSGSESVFVNIFRPFSFHADAPVAPPAVESGTTATITINLFNTGKATIYNVCCKLECRGFLDSGTYYLGNIEPESSLTATLSPIAADRNYGPLGDKSTEKYGSVSGKIIITYEDEAGTEYTEEKSVTTEITAPPDEIEEPEIKEIKYSSQWWISIVVLLIVIDGLILFAAYYMRKHRV